MASKLMVAGIAVVVLGGFLFVLFSLLFPTIGASLYPFYVTTGSQDRNNSIISHRESEIALVEGIPRTPIPIMGVQIKASFYLDSNIDWECNVSLIHEVDGDTTDIPSTTKFYSGDGEDPVLATIFTSLSAGYSSQVFNIIVRIENNGASTINLVASRVDISYTLLAQILPLIIGIVGLILTIVGFITTRGPKVPKAKPAPGGGEPTLQWGGGAAKQPKMAIKSTAAPKKTKKVVKKATPAAGAQQACKFCGKPVPASAFFCPHCYGKLR